MPVVPGRCGWRPDLAEQSDRTLGRIAALSKSSKVEHRKRRVRQHIIADISANHVEFFALRKGFSVQRIQNDYGIDLQLATYDAKGYIENGWISVQLKATDTIKMRSKGTAVAFTADARDLRMWQKEIYPVILIVYDAKTAKAYWTYVQRYFESGEGKLGKKAKTLVLRLRAKDRISATALARFADFKKAVQDHAEVHVSHL